MVIGTDRSGSGLGGDRMNPKPTWADFKSFCREYVPGIGEFWSGKLFRDLVHDAVEYRISQHEKRHSPSSGKPSDLSPQAPATADRIELSTVLSEPSRRH
jgi:hypothetical protein